MFSARPDFSSSSASHRAQLPSSRINDAAQIVSALAHSQTIDLYRLSTQQGVDLVEQTGRTCNTHSTASSALACAHMLGVRIQLQRLSL